MKINKIKLENIRSYTNNEINFPEGSILLSGDVGTGKSSILLALDFALFGLRTGSLSGGSLLRNGTDKGGVELELELDNKKIEVKRSLRRSASSISQEPGTLIINGEKEDLSPVELKDKILNLIRYPKEFLTKNKSLIYRYTVYTPQEEMKHILLSDRESRLEILRKVFGVDKYKRIKDNSKIFIQYLKGRRKELAGKIADLNDKIDLRKAKAEYSSKLKKSIEQETNKINELNELIKLEDKKIKSINENVKILNEFKNRTNVLTIDKKHKSERIIKNNAEIPLLKEQIESLKLELKKEVKVDVNIMHEKEKLVDSLNKSINERNSKLGALKNRIFNSEDIKEKISTLDFCPLCKQKVTKGHVDKVISDENFKIKDSQTEIKKLENEVNTIEETIINENKIINEIKRQASLAESLKIKKGYLEEKNRLLSKIIEESNILKQDVENIENEEIVINKKIKDLKDIENQLKESNNKRNNILERKKEFELSKNTLETEFRALNSQIMELEKEIESKTKDKKELLKLTEIQNWIEEQFVKMMDIIERQILSKVHNDFNSLFQKWFNMLIEEENVKLSLDEEFSPIIEQNGHIIDYVFLSGGEKTAAALAYRLALNQVINSLMSIIKTRDLLILDEPTDGFSELQIDRMREVLNELKMKQMIIVSHESKIESFVDKVIYLKKNDHITEVVNHNV